jgi:hypothetical protein
MESSIAMTSLGSSAISSSSCMLCRVCKQACSQSSLSTWHLPQPVSKDAADPGMGVLDIIDRVGAGLLSGQVQVKIQVAVSTAVHKESSGPHLYPPHRADPASVTYSPERLDILTGSPPRTGGLSCMMITCS